MENSEVGEVTDSEAKPQDKFIEQDSRELPELFRATAPVDREEKGITELVFVEGADSSTTSTAPTAESMTGAATALDVSGDLAIQGVQNAIEWESGRLEEKVEFDPNMDTDQLLMDDDLNAQLKAIPKKMAFKIGEVADILGVKQYVLRYWETEFEILKPKKSKFNQRMYERRDVEILLMIKKLLYRDRFSIEGARHALKKLRKSVRAEKQTEKQVDSVNQALVATKEKVEDLIHDLRELRLLFR